MAVLSGTYLAASYCLPWLASSSWVNSNGGAAAAGGGAGQGAETLARGCACVAAGFCGYQLWALVHHRLFYSRPAELARHTLLLCLYSCAAYKAAGAPLLALCLVGEGHGMVRAGRQLAALLRGGSGELPRGGAAGVVDTAAFVACRLLPQLYALLQARRAALCVWVCWFLRVVACWSVACCRTVGILTQRS